MIAEIISPDDVRWAEVVERVPHDIYHRPEYVRCAARYEGGQPGAFYAEEAGSRFLIPLVIRELPADLDAPAHWRDATTPYGYVSPIVSDRSDVDSLRAFLGVFQTVGQRQGIVTAFARLHPLLPLADTALREFGQVEKHGQTVAIDLTLSPDQLWSQTRANHRRGINKLLRGGFQATMDDWGSFGEFPSLYARTMERVAASSFYRFPEGYFEELRRSLAARIHYCRVLSAEGEIAAAGLFTESGGIVQYHLGATSDQFLDQAPSKLMFHFAREWAQARGNAALHLGGGVNNKADPLFHFKAGFSHWRVDFCTYRMVLDERRYAMLNRLRDRRAQGNRDRRPTFFPPYRAA